MKNLVNTLVLFLIGTNFSNVNGGIFSWMFKGYETYDHQQGQDKVKLNDPAEEESEYSEPSCSNVPFFKAEIDREVYEDVIPAAKIPFELTSADEKFLTEVSQYISPELSELDVCHHKVIIGLQSSCSELSEEEISKIAVNLLNCQSLVERRKIYPCTQEMLLHECTKSMDPDTWSAYQIVSNRVRAVCYHFRQQQFRAKTEMTVDKLMSTAEHQINSMKILENSQNLLKDTTSETLDKLKVGHGEIQKQQDQLFNANANIHSYVSSNLRELAKEKRLISSGQKELSRITRTIKQKLEDAQEQLKVQGDGQRETHQRILQDLAEIQDSASKVWEQLDISTQKILLTHEQTVSHYAQLMEDLHKMNSTVHHLTVLLIKMRQKVEEKFSWITSLVGDTDTTVQKIYSFVLHICYGLLGMVAASFLQVPYTTRMALIILVPLNALAELKNNTGLHFSTLTLILASCMFFNLSSIGVVKVYYWRKDKKNGPSNNAFSEQLPQSLPPLQLPSAPIRSSSPTYSASDLQRNANKFSERPQETTNALLESTKNYLNESEAYKADYLDNDDKENLIQNPTRSLFNSSIERRDFATINSPTFMTNFPSLLRSTDKSFRERSNHQLFSVDENSTLFDGDSPRYSDRTSRARINYSMDRSRSSTPLKESCNSLTRSLTPKRLCLAISKNGRPCKITVSTDSLFCHRHVNGSRESTPY